jgi:hypothetical protein
MQYQRSSQVPHSRRVQLHAKRGSRAARASIEHAGHTDKPIELRNGQVLSGPDLSVEVNGLRLPNPFIIGSGPPGTNYQVMKRAFQEGWGGVIVKTLSLEADKVSYKS